MKKRTNILFSKFSTSTDLSYDSVVKTFQVSPYNEEKGYGYENIEIIEEGIIYLTLIKKTITSVLNYNIQKGQFTKIDVPIFDEIEFCLDFNKNLFYSYGISSNHNKIKSALRNTFDFNFTYIEINNSPIEVMNKIIKGELDYTIKEIVIQNFRYSKGIKGKYFASIDNQLIAKDIINQYGSDILKISLDVTNEEEYSLFISSNNTLSIKCDYDSFYLILEDIKNRLYG